MRSIFKSLKLKYIISGLIIGIVSLCFISAAAYYVSYSIVLEQHDMRMQAIADRNAAQLNQWFVSYMQLIDNTASDIELTESFVPKILMNIFAEKMLMSEDNIKAIFLGTPDDNRIHVIPAWIPPPEYQVAEQSWFKDAVAADGKMVVSKPMNDSKLNPSREPDTVVTFSIAVHKGENLYGVLASDISLKEVKNIVNHYSFGPKSYAFLLDSEGNIMTHPHKAFYISNGTLMNINTVAGVEYSDLIKVLGDKKQIDRGGSVRVKDYDGIYRNVVLSRIASSGWILGIATDEAEYSAPLKKLLYGFAIAMLVSLLAGVVVMLRLVEGMTHPISLLCSAVRSFSANDMDVRVNLDNGDEFGELAANFNKMADVIQEHQQNLEKKVATRTQELQEKNDNIMESIDYAERLQRAILPPLAGSLLIPEDKCFALWRPKNVVGGDMYWCRTFGDFVVLVVADCTGHGVPGALMTMALSSILDGLPRDAVVQTPSSLLFIIHTRLQETLRQNSDGSLANDGADIALCILNKKEKTFHFSGAKLGLFLEKDGIITEYKGTKHSVGYSKRYKVVFEDRSIDWIFGSVVYITTDGLLDQNSEEGKGGIGRKGFVNLLHNIAGKPFAEQEQQLEMFIANSLEHAEQRDDITVLAFEISEIWNGEYAHEQQTDRS